MLVNSYAFEIIIIISNIDNNSKWDIVDKWKLSKVKYMNDNYTFLLKVWYYLVP